MDDEGAEVWLTVQPSDDGVFGGRALVFTVSRTDKSASVLTIRGSGPALLALCKAAAELVATDDLKGDRVIALNPDGETYFYFGPDDEIRE